jgi:uncharacterized NAD-dependent epimerase/dehydratase family protein
MVLCHDPQRKVIWSHPKFPIPDLGYAITRYEEAAQLTNPDAVVVGISLDTSRLDVTDARRVIADIEAEHSLPCFDPMRTSLEPLLARIERT